MSDEVVTAQTVYLLIQPCEPVGEGIDGHIGVRLTIEEATSVYRSLAAILGQRTEFETLDKHEVFIALAALFLVVDNTDLPADDRAVLRGLIDKLRGNPTVTIARPR